MAKGVYQDWISEDGITRIKAWVRDGLTNEQICHNIGISEKQFYEWCKKYGEFSEALKKTREVVDIEVENALFKRAMGYNATIRKTFKVKDVEFVDGKKIRETERLEVGYDEVHVPADTTAQIFWLKNRKPSVWRDKVVDASDNSDIENLMTLAEMIKGDK